VALTTRIEKPDEETIAAEAKKGYGLLLLGRKPASEGDAFHEQISNSAAEFTGPFAVAIARGTHREKRSARRLNILVPVSGTSVSRHGAEVAIALAQASQGSVTALHVGGPRGHSPRSWRRRVGSAIAPLSGADAIIRDIVRLGDPYGVEVKGAVHGNAAPAEAVLRQLKRGQHNLLVMGVSPRPGAELSFGQTAGNLLAEAECSVLFVTSEPFAGLASSRTPTRYGK
jgi:nucleotide-binding universal stress UspA family protein